MPQILRMPSTDDLPPGIKRQFVAELHIHFRDAGRPSLAHIAQMTGRPDGALPVSRETVRRLLTGQTLSTWAKVDAVLQALCRLGNQDPDRRRWPESSDWNDDGDTTTCREHLRQLWNDAVDGIEPEDPLAAPPAPHASGRSDSTPPQSVQHDPWATQQTPAPAKQYSDEPPF